MFRGSVFLPMSQHGIGLGGIVAVIFFLVTVLMMAGALALAPRGRRVPMIIGTLIVVLLGAGFSASVWHTGDSRPAVTGAVSGGILSAYVSFGVAVGGRLAGQTGAIGGGIIGVTIPVGLGLAIASALSSFGT